MVPINQEHAHTVVQIVLSYLEDARNTTPNDMLDGIQGGKHLLRAILSGTLVICENRPSAASAGSAEMPLTPTELVELAENPKDNGTEAAPTDPG